MEKLLGCDYIGLVIFPIWWKHLQLVTICNRLISHPLWRNTTLRFRNPKGYLLFFKNLYCILFYHCIILLVVTTMRYRRTDFYNQINTLILEEEIKIFLQEKSQENILNTHLYFSLKISLKSWKESLICVSKWVEPIKITRWTRKSDNTSVLPWQCWCTI